MADNICYVNLIVKFSPEAVLKGIPYASKRARHRAVASGATVDFTVYNQREQIHVRFLSNLLS